jgi:hypothetical protein
VGFLYFIGILAVAGVCLIAIVRLFRMRREGPITPVSVVTVSTGGAQTTLHTGALRSAGIWFMVKDVSVAPYRYGGDASQIYELWVKNEDSRARAVLGLGELRRRGRRGELLARRRTG